MSGDEYTFNDAIGDINSTLGIIEDLECNYLKIWDQGGDFFENVRYRLASTLKSIKERESVTENQRRAINNWGAGVRKWHPDYK